MDRGAWWATVHGAMGLQRDMTEQLAVSRAVSLRSLKSVSVCVCVCVCTYMHSFWRRDEGDQRVLQSIEMGTRVMRGPVWTLGSLLDCSAHCQIRLLPNTPKQGVP